MSDEKTLEFINLQYDVVNNDLSKSSNYFRVTNYLSGKFVSGTLTAILGQSGSGKSQFFNLLTGNIGKKDKTSGKILYNTKERNLKEWMNLTSYLPQDDIYFPKLTLLETLYYYAKFYNIDIKKRKNLLEEILNDCRIFYKKDIKIESLSGGEKKRAMLCIAMLKQPKILILDEPTTGLDSHNALLIVDSLRKYAQEKNAIVILTAHQPGEALFSLFDDLLYLTRKGVFYQGKVSELEKWLAAHKIYKPDKVSLAEFMFELTVNDAIFKEAKDAKTKVEEIINSNQPKITNNKTEICNNLFAVTSWEFNYLHIKTLLYRNFSLYYRSGNFWKFIFFKFLLLGIYGVCFYTFSNYILNFKFICNINNQQMIIPFLHFSENLSNHKQFFNYFLAHLIFNSFFLYILIYNVAFVDVIIFNENVYNYEVRTGKYSSLSYALFKIIQNFIVSVFFSLLCLIMMIGILFKINISWQSIFILLYLTVLFCIFYTISMSFVNVLPISTKVTSGIFYFTCVSNLILEFIYYKLNQFYYFVKIMLKLFPHFNLHNLLFLNSYYKLQKFKSNDLNEFENKIYVTIFNFISLNNSLRFIDYANESKEISEMLFLDKLWLKKLKYIGHLLFSILLCLFLYVTLWVFRTTPNQRLKISQ